MPVAWTAANYGVMLRGTTATSCSFPCGGSRALSHDALSLRLERPGDVVPLFTSVYVRLPTMQNKCRIGQETSVRYGLAPGCVGRGAPGRRPLHTLETCRPGDRRPGDLASCVAHSGLFSGLVLPTPMKKKHCSVEEYFVLSISHVH
jgi:hypothetical protein